jgi:hypothetical protein
MECVGSVPVMSGGMRGVYETTKRRTEWSSRVEVGMTGIGEEVDLS